ncbi:hypothetical protein [Gluconobacter sp. DsW_058]|uniref:hypothetical protein n=1 Tax=Gluconobacter sp. DsW_058 TaxID=1511210 RepID=UPI00117AC537|nr:hypothetical protein [Gluconobacter sp. DsW_058]
MSLPKPRPLPGCPGLFTCGLNESERHTEKLLRANLLKNIKAELLSGSLIATARSIHDDGFSVPRVVPKENWKTLKLSWDNCKALRNGDECLTDVRISKEYHDEILQKIKNKGGRPSKISWSKAAAIMVAWIAENGEPGAERGDHARAVENLLLKMGEHAPCESEAKKFVSDVTREVTAYKSKA